MCSQPAEGAARISRGHCHLWFYILCLVLFASTSALAKEKADLEHIIAPVSEEWLGTLLGRGMALPGDCRLTAGGANGPIITAQYACGGGTVVVELRHPVGAPSSALRTQRFSISVRSGSAPPGLLDALSAIIRSHEGRFEWKAIIPARPPSSVLGLPLGVCGITFLALIVQALLARRQAARPPARAGGKMSAGDLGAIARAAEEARELPALPTIGIVAAYLVTRLTYLTRLPAFVDESIHIQWARSSNLAAEFSVGKWLPVEIISIYSVLPCSPLCAARLASVSMGLLTLLACVFINRELFSCSEAMLAGIIYAALPFALLYDRLALADTYVTAFGAWAALSAIAMIRHEGPLWPLVMSVATYGAMLSKPTGGVFLVGPVLVCTLLVPTGLRRAYLSRSLPTLIGGTLLMAFLAWERYGMSLVTSQSALTGQGLWQRLGGNLETAAVWLTALLTPPVALAAIAGAVCAVFGVIRKRNAEMFLATLFLVLSLPYAFVATTWYPNYLLPAVVPVSLLASRAIVVAASSLVSLAGGLAPRVRTRSRAVLVTMAALLVVARSAPRDLALIASPEQAGLPPPEDRFVRGPASGCGLVELADFLRQEATKGALSVVRFDLGGQAKEGLEVYLEPSDLIHLYTVDAYDGSATTALSELASQRRTLFVADAAYDEWLRPDSQRYRETAARIWTAPESHCQSGLEVWELSQP